MTIVCYTYTDPLRDPELFRHHYDTMPEYRKRKIDRLVFDEDKRASLAAGILLKEGLDRLGTVYDSSSEPVLNGNGKPGLGIPGICYSLSHTRGRAMCIISEDDCGCDVESYDSADQDIAERFFTEDERRQIMSSCDRDAMFVRLWTLKESFLKTTGTGLTVPLDSFSILMDEGKISAGHTGGRSYHFREFFPGDGYSYSCCSVTDDIPDRMRYVVL